jgi:hypothetical protein
MAMIHKYTAKENQNLFTMTDIRKHSFAARAVEKWNGLERDI